MARDDTACRLKRPVYLIDGARSPFLKARGKPGPFRAADLAARTAIPLLLRQPFAPDRLDEVILGCVMPGPDEANIARVAALRIGCGERVPAFTVQRNCASGLQAIDTAAQRIADGCADLILAGGVEAMSHAPLLFGEAFVAWLAQWRRARTLTARARALARFRISTLAPLVGLLRGLTDPVVGLSMGQTAENLATRFGITRNEMDAFAMRSHHRVATAQHAGRLDEEIVLLADCRGQAHRQDDGVRPDTGMEALAKLPPAFDRPFGRITAGNSAQITDGAAWLLLASETAVERLGIEPMARILDSQWAGLDPSQMGLGPVHAMAPILERRGLDSPDIDYWEINEAFAAQVLACLRAWQDPDYCRNQLGLEKAFTPIDEERLNVDGGAIAIGHPVGASGARILLHLARVLQREGGRLGMASLCIGGGQGGAMLIESTREARQ